MRPRGGESVVVGRGPSFDVAPVVQVLQVSITSVRWKPIVDSVSQYHEVGHECPVAGCSGHYAVDVTVNPACHRPLCAKSLTRHADPYDREGGASDGFWCQPYAGQPFRESERCSPIVLSFALRLVVR